MTDRPDAAPPEEEHNLPGVSRPNYCPDGAAHSWDSDGDEWRCSFCPAVFRASPPSDAAPVAIEVLAQAIHREWRDGMLRQKRHVSDERMKWGTLPVQDRRLDRFIASKLRETFSFHAHPEDAPGGPWWEFGAGDFIHQGDRILRGCDLTREELTVVRDALNRVDRTKGDDEHGS